MSLKYEFTNNVDRVIEEFNGKCSELKYYHNGNLGGEACLSNYYHKWKELINSDPKKYLFMCLHTFVEFNLDNINSIISEVANVRKLGEDYYIKYVIGDEEQLKSGKHYVGTAKNEYYHYEKLDLSIVESKRKLLLLKIDVDNDIRTNKRAILQHLILAMLREYSLEESYHIHDIIHNFDSIFNTVSGYTQFLLITNILARQGHTSHNFCNHMLDEEELKILFSRKLWKNGKLAFPDGGSIYGYDWPQTKIINHLLYVDKKEKAKENATQQST